jgi:hypothetical protein
VPVMVTAVPPAGVPDAGEIPVSVGAEFDTAVYVNPCVNVPLWVSLLVTVTSTVPAACAGVMAVIDVLFITVTPVACVPPRLTVAPARNPVPVIVTAVPPAGASAIRKSSVSVPSAKYVDPELRRLQKELIQLRESLRPWKIGSAPWLSIQQQLVDKGSEIRTLLQRSKPRRGIVG